MPSKLLPASIRYLKARLHILQRPAVWASASVLLVAIVFLAETWKHPERFATPNQPSSNGLTSADSESAEAPVRPAPLDPLSSVDEPPFSTSPGDATAQPSPFSAEDFANSGQTDRLPSPLLLPRSSASRSASSSSVPDPFAAIRTDRDSANRSSLSSGSEGSTTNPYSRSGSASSPQQPFSAADPSDNSSSPNPLQSAIDRSRSPSSVQPSPPSSSVNSSSPDANSTGMTASPELQTPAAPSPGQVSGQSSFVQPQPLPGQPSSGQTQPQPQFIPQTSPAPGTTGYTPPPAFRTNANTPAGPSFGNYNNSYNNNSYNNPSGVPSTVFPSTTQPTTANPTAQPQVSQPQSQATPAPFSIPRAVPGRSIGGGQINTFSNP